MWHWRVPQYKCVISNSRHTSCTGSRWVLMCLLCWDQHKTCRTTDSSNPRLLHCTQIRLRDSELLHIYAYVWWNHEPFTQWPHSDHAGTLIMSPGVVVCVCVVCGCVGGWGVCVCGWMGEGEWGVCWGVCVCVVWCVCGVRVVGVGLVCVWGRGGCVCVWCVWCECGGVWVWECVVCGVEWGCVCEGAVVCVCVVWVCVCVSESVLCVFVVSWVCVGVCVGVCVWVGLCVCGVCVLWCEA